MNHPRELAGDALAVALCDSRERTWSLVDDLSDAQWQVPQGAGVNPPAWELAHLAWFAEFWILRGPHRLGSDGFVHAERAPRVAGPDEHFDSARLQHAARWAIPLPSRQRLKAMLDAQLEACLAALPSGHDDAALYFHRLALFHEDMHAEALSWMRAALGLPAPQGMELRRCAQRSPITVRGGRVDIGWPRGRGGFAFDNEQPSMAVELADFEIDATPVTAGQFLGFVEGGGYEDASLWPGEAGVWRAASGRRWPARWRRSREQGWEMRWFDRWHPLDADRPVIHVNAWEAEAYCRWAGRQLPSAAQWEHAASSAEAGGRFLWGRTVWEWTSDPFGPYPGFEPGPYKDYSAPWFGDHRELRGGAFATHERLHDPRYRNFFLPERDDVFSGFRTVASIA